MNIDHVFVDTNGITLHVAIAGPEEGQLVILLHGFPDFWYGWINQIEALVTAGYRVLIPDQRGYNSSDKPENISDYNLDELAQDVIGLIQDTGETSANIIGHDFGAAVGWHLATHHPEYVKKLAILNVPHVQVMKNFLLRNFGQLLKSWYIFFFQIPRLPEYFLSQNNWQWFANGLITSSNRGSFSKDTVDKYIQAWSQPNAMSSMINWYRAIFRSNLKDIFKKDTLPTIDTPTLILWGVKDSVLSKEMAEQSIVLCKRGELIFFEQATHWVQRDLPEEINRQLLLFIK